MVGCHVPANEIEIDHLWNRGLVRGSLVLWNNQQLITPNTNEFQAVSLEQFCFGMKRWSSSRSRMVVQMDRFYSWDPDDEDHALNRSKERQNSVDVARELLPGLHRHSGSLQSLHILLPDQFRPLDWDPSLDASLLHPGRRPRAVGPPSKRTR